eukprot:TRINITY_DN4481_c0_g1_i2.p1 TRINITY_DN4481_c0_g1~~TRINITY_DN4481_c0_g1_i2.p1  ORF type:complete len:476 (+),score=66.72 TRINITY_DN4481_c0_g1_i2:50-1429(+)
MDVENGSESEEVTAPKSYRKEKVGMVVSLILLLLTPIVPLLEDGRQSRMMFILLTVVTLWLTETFPVSATGMLIGPLLVVFHITDQKKAFAPYADPLMFLFYGAFIIAKSMSRHGLDRRAAAYFMSLRLIRGSKVRTKLCGMITGCLMSMWISNTASAAILIPIVQSTLSSRDASKENTGAIIGIAYSCSVGGLGTLVGTPPNLIAHRLLEDEGYTVDFLLWLAIGLPTALILVGVIFAVMQVMYRSTSGETITFSAFGTPLSKGEKVTAACFLVAVFGWLLPPLLKLMSFRYYDEVHQTIPVCLPPMIAIFPLFLIRDEKDVILPWKEALQIDWGLILLFGGGISLGNAMQETGLAGKVGGWVVESTGIESQWSVLLIFTFFTIFFTEICSNTASANIIIPLAIGVCKKINISPVPTTLAIAFASSCSFMMPIATGIGSKRTGGFSSVCLSLKRGFSY